MDIQILKACATGWQGKQEQQYKAFRDAWALCFVDISVVMHCVLFVMMFIKLVCPSAGNQPFPTVPLIIFTVVIAVRWLLKACMLPQYILSVNVALRYFEAMFIIAFVLGYVQSSYLINTRVMLPLIDVGLTLLDGVIIQVTASEALAFSPLRLVVMYYAVAAIQGCNMAALSHTLEAQVSHIQACSWPGDLSAAQWFQIFGSTITFLVVSFGHEYLCRKAFLDKQTFSVEATHSRTSSLYPQSVFGVFNEGSDVAGPSCMATTPLPSITAASVVPSTMPAPEELSAMAASVTPYITADPAEPSVIPSIMAATPEEPSVIAEPEDPYDEMTDEEIYDMIDAIKNGTYGALAIPKHHTVWLRIPDADPDDLAPDAKMKLKEKFETENPGYIVTDIVFQRGSLLVGVRTRPDGSRSTDAAQVLKAVKHCSWLAWLGLPACMDMSAKVNTTNEPVNLLRDMPLAVTVPKSGDGVCVVSLPLRCSELPTGAAIKASLGDQILECDVVEAGVEDVPTRFPSTQGRFTLKVKLPVDTPLCEPSCGLLTVIVQDLGDKVIVGDRTVVLLNEALAVLEPELCGMRLLRPQDMPHSLKARDVEQPWGADIVYALGLWLQTLHAEHQLPDCVMEDGSDIVEPVISQKLADLWRAGNHILMYLVGEGCTDSAKHVIDLLLKSPALRVCVPGGRTEGLGDTPSFHDFIRGAQNTQGCTLMHLAVFNGSYAMLDEVMRWSDAYNLPSLWDIKDEHGMTPLHLARLVKDGQVAKYLLCKGDPVILQSWNQGGAVKFSKRMAVMEASMSRQSRNTSSIKPLYQQKLTHTRSLSASKRVPVSAPSIRPTAAAAVGEPRGGDMVGELRGGEILDLSQEGSYSTIQAGALPKQAENSSQYVNFRKTLAGYAAHAEGGHSTRVVRKPSLVASISECFFGFADCAMEKQYVTLQAQQRSNAILVMCVGFCATSIYWLWKIEGLGKNMVGCILLEPGAPVGTVFSLLAILMGRWRWVEPGIVVGNSLRLLSLAVWMWYAPAFLPASTHRWAGPISSIGLWLGFAFTNATANFLWNIRFKYGLLFALIWMAMVPSYVARSSIIIYSWPLQLSLVIVTMLRLQIELKARSRFLNSYYPTAGSKLALTAAPAKPYCMAAPLMPE